MIKAFLCDIHGTLIEKGGHDALANAWVAATAFLRRFGYSFVSLESYRQAYWATLQSFQHELAIFKDPDFYAWYGGILARLGVRTDKSFIDELNQAYMTGFEPRTKRLPGAKELMSCLRERGYQLGAVSNGFARNTLVDLKRTELLPYFDVIVSSSDVGVRKPDPTVVHEALAGLHLTADETILVGNDIVEDGVAARRAGLRFALVQASDGMEFFRNSVLDYGQLAETANPDWRVHSLSELGQKICQGEVG